MIVNTNPLTQIQSTIRPSFQQPALSISQMRPNWAAAAAGLLIKLFGTLNMYSHPGGPPSKNACPKSPSDECDRSRLQRRHEFRKEEWGVEIHFHYPLETIGKYCVLRPCWAPWLKGEGDWGWLVWGSRFAD